MLWCDRIGKVSLPSLAVRRQPGKPQASAERRSPIENSGVLGRGWSRWGGRKGEGFLMPSGIAAEGIVSAGFSPWWRQRAFRLSLWLIAAVVGLLVVLNYGFANLALGLGGANLPVVLLLLALAGAAVALEAADG